MASVAEINSLETGRKILEQAVRQAKRRHARWVVARAAAVLEQR